MEVDDFEGFGDEATPLVGVVCEICGSSEFVVEGGFYFCSVCQTQSQQARQYVEREEYSQGPVRHSRVSTLRDRKKGKKEKKELKREMPIFEGLNCCLKLMTERLIKMGFPEDLKNTAFQLWTKYLLKRKAIFVNKKGSEIACLKSAANMYHGKNCGCYYKPSNKLRQRPRRKKNTLVREEVVNKSEAEDPYSQSMAAKLRRTNTRMKAMRSEYESQLAEMMGEEGGDEDVLAGTSETVSKKGKELQRKRVCKLTKYSKMVVNEMRKLGCRKTELAKTKMYNILKPEVCNMKTVMAIIFVALRQLGCNVVITDIIRLVANGTLYFSSLRLLLIEDGQPANIGTKYMDRVFRYGSVGASSYHSLDYHQTIEDLLNYLGIIDDFRYPRFKEVVPKFIDDFAMPRELECLVLQLHKLIPADSKELAASSIIQPSKTMPEFLVMAALILTLKFLFGMDDLTEAYQSKFARTVNSVRFGKSEPEASDYKRLFDPETWILYLRRRQRIYNSELFNPAFYYPATRDPWRSMDNLVKKFSGMKGINYDAPKEEEHRSNITTMFKKFADHNRPDNEEAPSLPDYVSFSSPQEQTLQSYQSRHPTNNVLNPLNTPHLLNDFTKSRIDYIIHPEKHVDLLTKSGYTVKVLPGTARLYAQELKASEDDPKTIHLFQPFKGFDLHIPRGFSYPSSLKFLMELSTQFLSTDRFQGTGTSAQSRIEDTMEELLAYYTRYQKAGLLRVFS